jgi:RND family efflux transporter MFP subunit
MVDALTAFSHHYINIHIINKARRQMKPLGWLWTTLLVAAGMMVPAAWADQAVPNLAAFDARVESESQATVSAQIPGSVLQVLVRAGDMVKAGQLLIRLEGVAAEQSAQAASAQLDLAKKDLERQRQLFAQEYISQAAMDRAEAQYKARAAEAMGAQSVSGHAQIRAPFEGVVAEVLVEAGDMAAPGRPLVRVVNPNQLRITAHVPQSALAANLAGAKIQIPDLPEARQWITPTSVRVFPTTDPMTHTVEVRLGIPAKTSGIVTGSFARAWLPATGAMAAPVQVPQSAVLRRTELTAVYVLDAQNHPVLRQVRLGRVVGNQVELMSGVNPGERVVQDAHLVESGRP